MSVILQKFPLGAGPWPCLDPFLLCVHHLDAYPAGNEAMAPATSLEGRNLGQDFSGKDGWSMYHGLSVPGFPPHPHRGFETVTIVRRGLIDHTDSLGAAARYGHGDVQWLTTGKGIVHAEMFPLVNTAAPNPTELFQIWVNLPAKNKMVAPYFSMFWKDQLPRLQWGDAGGPQSEVVVVAGAFGHIMPLAPPPDSWAAQSQSDLAIWTVRMDAGAVLNLPRALSSDSLRTLYLFKGQATVGDELVRSPMALLVDAQSDVSIQAGGEEVEMLILQACPIGEPVAQHGPFVMNTREELAQAFADYQNTQFGTWPWDADNPVHPREAGRFAKGPDRATETPHS